MKKAEIGVHKAHCYQGQYEKTCKYGDLDCPAFKLELVPLDNIGTLMTLKNFIESCETGCLIDYDGHGYYAFKNKQSNKVVIPSFITGRQSTFSMKTGKSGMKNIKKKIDKKFTHVMWYNK